MLYFNVASDSHVRPVLSSNITCSEGSQRNTGTKLQQTICYTIFKLALPECNTISLYLLGRRKRKQIWCPVSNHGHAAHR